MSILRKLIFGIFAILIGFNGCSYRKTQLKPETALIAPSPKAIELFIDGLNYELNRNYPAALLMYQEALFYDSTSAKIYFNIGKNYLRLNKDESAMMALRRSLEIDPNQIEAWDMLASIYARQGWWDLVEKTYLSIISRDSTDIETYRRLAMVYLRLDQKDKAVSVYDQILKMQPEQDPKTLIAIGELYFDLNRFEDAGKIFERLVQSMPESGFGYFGLGMTKEAILDTAGAVEYYQEAILRTPQLDEARDRLGKIFIARKEWNDAIQLYTEAVQTDTTDLGNWLELGDLFQQNGDSLQAEQLYLEIQSRFPKEWQAHFHYGRFLMRQQNYGSAIQSFQKVQILAPENPLGWLFSGMAYAFLDSVHMAKIHLEKAISIEPDDPLGNYYLGTIYVQLKEYNHAVPLLQKAIEIRPKWISAISALAGIYESMKQYDQADSLFQVALSLDPNDALLLNNYAYSLSLRGERLQMALEMAQRALSQDPENGAYLDTVGWICFLLGQHDDALSYVQKAVKNREDSYEVYDHLGDIYAAMNMWQQARDAWKRALELDASNADIQKKLGQSIR